MSSHLRLCLHPEYPCDLGGSREFMCEVCLTYVIRRDRPAGWTPRVKASKSTKKETP